MKLTISLFFLTFVLFSCQLKEQAEELQALKECTYEVVSADSIYLSNINVSNLIKENSLDLINAPQLAFSYLQKTMPFNAIVNLRITNPGTQEAAINEFEYKVFIKDTEITQGYYDKKISIPPNGGTTLVPVRINQDVYPLISSPGNQTAVSDFFGSKDEKTAIITLKIKPSIAIGSEMIKYPDYISVDKTVSNKKIIAYLESLSNSNTSQDTVLNGTNP